MKSKIRSRWYRSSEKPLESNSSPSSDQAPFGEVDLSEDKKLTDDLSNATPPANSGKQEGKQRNERDRRSRDGSRRPRDGSRRPRDGGDRRSRDGDRRSRDGGDRRPRDEDRRSRDGEKNPKNRGQDKRDGHSSSKSEKTNGDGQGERGKNKRSRSRNRKTGGKQSSTSNTRTNPPSNNAKGKKPTTKGGVSGFLSKLFGK